MATGVPPLDRSLRGGLRDEKLLILGGAPGAGKTSLARQIGDNLARAGVAVGWLAADEETAGIDVRRMQALGISREEAEMPSDETIARITLALEPLPFVIYDIAEDWTVEAVIEDLAKRFPNHRRVFIGDSLQTLRAHAGGDSQQPRERIDTVLEVTKHLARQPSTRCAVILTSELARGSYRNATSPESTSDLAAFKESGSIEYGAHVLCVLRSHAEIEDVISIAQPKNRIGPKCDFLLRFDRVTTNLSETSQEVHDDQKRDEIQAAILAALSPDDWPSRADLIQNGAGLEELKSAVRLQGVQFANGHIFKEVLLELVRDKLVRLARSKYRPAGPSPGATTGRDAMARPGDAFQSLSLALGPATVDTGNPVHLWLRARCTRGDFEERASALHGDFDQWATTSGHDQMTHRAFADSLASAGLKRGRRDARGQFWCGARLSDSGAMA